LANSGAPRPPDLTQGVPVEARHPLDQGASLAFGWLIDRLTGDAYYDAAISTLIFPVLALRLRGDLDASTSSVLM
jgi:hypothetical protein